MRNGKIRQVSLRGAKRRSNLKMGLLRPPRRARNDKFVVGLTGGLCSGKSAALDEFRRCGALTLDSDTVVRRLYRMAAIKRKIIRIFGPQVAKRSQLDRKKIAEIAFSDAERRKNLEELVHPKVAKVVEQELKRGKGKIAVVEVPLLFEAGWKKKFDATIVIAAKSGLAAHRYKTRTNNQKDFQKRMAAQWPLARKIKMGDYVVHNNGSKPQLINKVRKVWKRLNQKHLT